MSAYRIETKAKDQVIFITGASSGIGAALAEEFSLRGARLVVTGRRLDRLEALASELRAKGREALALECDVTQENSLENAVTKTIEKFGRIDMVIANAGFGVAGKLAKLTVEDYRRQFETNVFGVLRTIYASLDQLKKNRGTLVLLGSVAGYFSLPGNSAYGMSKFAIRALADSLRYELMPHGVAVVHIAPGFVSSEIRQVSNKGVYKPDAVDSIPSWIRMPSQTAARKIADAALRGKKEQIITAHGKLVVFLKRHVPGALNFFVGRGLRGRTAVE